jgi:hypothetical protein
MEDEFVNEMNLLLAEPADLTNTSTMTTTATTAISTGRYTK